MIWIFFILGLAFADKLDRTYLPPPGSKFSGGSPGAIEVPLEHPKLHFSADNEYFNHPEIAIGIDGGTSKRPVLQNTYSSTTYPGNTFSGPATYPQNTQFSSKNGYSTVSPIDKFSKYSDNIQNPENLENLYNNHNQVQYSSDPNENQFQTTENYPQLFQGNVPISDISGNDFPNNLFSNQTKLYENKNIAVDKISQSNPSQQLATDFLNKQYTPEYGQYSSSSIPSIEANTNLISSTSSPSTINYDYSSTTIGPKQFYSSTLKPPQFSTITPIGSKNSPFFNYANIKNRPERIQAQADREASILNYESSISPEGYAYSYDTSNGIHGDESGVAVNGVKAKGSYSYIGDDGKLYSVVYTADENGFQPRGDHLPTSPPIPDAILKVIEQVSKEKEAGIVDDGSYDEDKYGYRNFHNGFYSPKSDFLKAHSDVEKNYRLFQNTKNNKSNYNGGIRNQITNKNDNETNTYQESINKSTIPGINSYTNPGNLENLGSQYPHKSYEFYNNTGIQQFGPYDTTDLETGDATNNKSPSDSFKQTYINPIIDSEGKQFSDKQTPTVDNVGKYNDFAVKLNKEPNVFNSDNSYTETGYQYNPPEYTGSNDFPPRFSDIYNTKKEILKQGNFNKITPKPFLTPYVSEMTEEKQKYNNGGPFENLQGDQYKEELVQNNNKYPSFLDGDLNRNDGYNRTDFVNIKSDIDPTRKFYQSEGTLDGNRAPQIINEGYSYQQGVLDSDKVSYGPFVTDPHIYTSSISTSTVVPTAFTSRINMSQSKEPKYSASLPQTSTGSIIPSTTYIPNVHQINIQLNKTNTLADYSTVRPEFINQHEGNVPSGTKLGSPTVSKYTTPGTGSSTNVPIIGNSYAPNLDITHNDEYNVHPTTEKNIGEDFRGPTQPQRFDPLTGYHY